MGKSGLFFTWIGVALLAAVSAESGKLKLKKTSTTIELFILQPESTEHYQTWCLSVSVS